MVSEMNDMRQAGEKNKCESLLSDCEHAQADLSIIRPTYMHIC